MLQLGNFTFDLDDYPEELPLGGSSLVSVEKYPGGRKSIQDFGAFDDPISLKGTFNYAGAVDKANSIDDMWRAGQPIQLTVASLRPRWVQITGFKPTYKNDYMIDYEITLEPVDSSDSNEILYASGAMMSIQSVQSDSSTTTTPTTTPTGATTSPQQTYVVVEGDTLWGIAANVYSDGSQYPYIVDANGIKDPNSIYPGQVLIIPTPTGSVPVISSAATSGVPTVTLADGTVVRWKD